MNITKVQIHPFISDKSPVQAYVDIIIDEFFIIRSMAIVKNKEEQYYYVTYPFRVQKNGTKQDIAHPLNNETRLYIENKVLDEYEIFLNQKASSKYHRLGLNNFR